MNPYPFSIQYTYNFNENSTIWQWVSAQQLIIYCTEILETNIQIFISHTYRIFEYDKCTFVPALLSKNFLYLRSNVRAILPKTIYFWNCETLTGKPIKQPQKGDATNHKI